MRAGDRGGRRGRTGARALAVALALATAGAFSTATASAASGMSGGVQWPTSVTGAPAGATGTMTFGTSGETMSLGVQTNGCVAQTANQASNAQVVSFGADTFYTPQAPSDAVGVQQCQQPGPQSTRVVALSKPLLDPLFFITDLDASNLFFNPGPSGGTVSLTTINADANAQLLMSGTELSDTYSEGTDNCSNVPIAAGNDPLCGTYQMTENGGAVSDFKFANVSKAGSGADGWVWSFGFPTATLTKAFSPTSVPAGVTSQLTFTIANNSATALSPMGYTDNLPSGLTLADATTSNNGDCGTPTITDQKGGALASGDTGVEVENLALAASATCTITVDVTSQNKGSYVNQNSNISTTVGNLVPATTATLTVTKAVPNVTCTTSPNIFNTGYNAATGGELPAGSADANWQFDTTEEDLATSYYSSVPPGNRYWAPAIVGNNAPGAWINSPYGNANWISNTYSPNVANQGVAGDFDFRYQFTLDPSVDPSTFSLAMDWYADNWVGEVFVNGVSQNLPFPPGNPYFEGGYAAGGQQSTTLKSDWQTGLNTIIVVVKSAPPEWGFLAQVRPSALCPVDLAVTKQADPQPYQPTQKLTYTVKATNNGPGPATNATVSDPLPSALSGAGFTWTCSASAGSNCTASGSGSVNDTHATIAAGGTLTYTVSGTVPSGTTGTLTNTATVTPPPGTPDPNCSPSCSAKQTDTGAAPAVSIKKQATVSPAADQNGAKAGDSISYSYAVTNTGNVDLTSVAVQDQSIGTVTCPTIQAPGLAPNDSVTCTANASTVVTHAEVDAGTPLSDTATATGTDAANLTSPKSAPDTATVDIVARSPSLEIRKTAKAANGDTNPITAGESVQYTYVVTNTGNVDMKSIQVSDPTAGAVTCDSLPATGLAPGATVDCKANSTYTVKQSDVDNGKLIDTATASGVDPAGHTDKSTPAQAEVDSAPDPEVSVQKTATVSPAADQAAAKVGDTIKYTYKVTNVGNVDLKSVAVDDPSIGRVSCPTPASPGLAPSTSETCTADSTHTVTQADVDAGKVVDQATATGTDNLGHTSQPSDPSTATVLTVPPVITTSVVKSATVTPAADQNAVQVGDTIAYSYNVTNTGNVDETSVSVSDQTQGPVSCPTPAAPGLAPGASETCDAVNTYTVTQADVDAGKVVDTATSTGTDKNGVTGPPSGPDTVTTDAATPAPSVSIQKHATVTPAADQGGYQVGDLIQYSYDVKNTGNVTLASVKVDDPSAGSVSCPTPTAPGLAPDASETCTADSLHVVTQADVDNGKITDTATATGTDLHGDPSPNSQPSSTTLDSVAPNPSLTLKKIPDASNGDTGAIQANETIQYSYLVINDGNVTISSVSVSDPAIVDGVSCPSPSLAPGTSETCTANNAYTVTNQNVLDDLVTDTGTVTGVDPTNNPITTTDTATVPTASPAPALSIQKTATASGDPNAIAVNDTISYSYVVTNTGNVDLTTVSVDDPNAGTVTCPTPTAPGLAPGASETCTADNQHSVTQGDVDAGSVTDTAAATGKDGNGDQATSKPSSATVYSQPDPTVSLTKSATVTPAGDQGAVKVGDTIAYSYKVKNTGNVDLTTITVKDPSLGKVDCPTPASPGLAPGASETCTAADYTVTQADVDAGKVVDEATATGSDTQTVTSPPSSGGVTVDTVAPAPAVTFKKVATVSPATDQNAIKVGDKIAYTYVITNTGNITLPNFQVNDPTLGPVTCPKPPSPGLAPGASLTCTAQATYTVTQADVDAGGATDKATLIVIDPKLPPIDPIITTDKVPSDPAPSVSVVKTATVDPRKDQDAVTLGDRIAYTFKVTNTGNVDLKTITVSDPTLGQVFCPTPVAPGLAPGRSEICTGEVDHTVNANDIRAHKVTNTATAVGIATNGTSSGSSTPSTATVGAAHAARRLVLKKVASNLHPRPGHKITYTLSVMNPGTVPVLKATVCDRLPQAEVYVRSSPRAHLSVGRYCWTIAKLGGRASKRFKLTVVVTSRRGKKIVNRATAAARGLRTAGASATIYPLKSPSIPCGTASRATTTRHRRPPTAKPAC